VSGGSEQRQSATARKLTGTAASLCGTCVFFGLFYAFVLCCLEPRILYFANALATPAGRTVDFPLFLKGMCFFREFVVRPGGLSEYVAACCSQFFYYRHGGPVILTLIAWIAFLAAGRLERAVRGGADFYLRFVPPLLLLAAWNRYTFRLSHHVSLVAGLVFATAWVLAMHRRRRVLARGLVFVAASALLYYVAGMAVFLFAGLCALCEVAVRHRTGSKPRRRNGGRKALLAGPAIAIAGVLVALCTLDRDARRVLKVNSLARTGNWEALLAEVGRHPSRAYPNSVMMDINRALYETGRLGDRMFSYHQSPASLLEVGAAAVSFKGACEILLDLGCVNEAEHVALEALEINGERPGTLRRLATISIVKDRPGAARIFLGALCRDIVHGGWAADTLQQLDRDPDLSSNPRIRHLRSVMPVTDRVVTSKTKGLRETMLLALLARNPENRMAREYLLAHYLLTRQPSKVACTFGRLRKSVYPVIPQHHAEALLLHQRRFGGQLVLSGSTIPRHAAEVIRGTARALSESGGTGARLSNTLASRFPGSYSSYFFAGRREGER